MIYITDSKFYEENEDLYNILSDYVIGEKVAIDGAIPETLIDVELSDCFMDDEGNFFAPVGYEWMRDEDGDWYKPRYDLATLDKLSVQQHLAMYQEPELNNPINFTN